MVPTCLGERPGALRRMPAGSPTPVWCIVRAEFFRGTGSSSGRDVSMSCIGNRSQSVMSKLEGGDDSMFCTRSCPRSSFPSITAFSEAGGGDGWSFRDPVCFDFKTFDSVGWSVIPDRGFSEREDGSTFCERDRFRVDCSTLLQRSLIPVLLLRIHPQPWIQCNFLGQHPSHFFGGYASNKNVAIVDLHYIDDEMAAMVEHSLAVRRLPPGREGRSSIIAHHLA